MQKPSHLRAFYFWKIPPDTERLLSAQALGRRPASLGTQAGAGLARAPQRWAPGMEAAPTVCRFLLTQEPQSGPSHGSQVPPRILETPGRRLVAAGF